MVPFIELEKNKKMWVRRRVRKKRVKKSESNEKIFCNQLYTRLNRPVKFSRDKYGLTYKFKFT